jgi:hypothetical protein
MRMLGRKPSLNPNALTWSPEKDKHQPSQYKNSNLLEKSKQANKKAVAVARKS